jgi:hypothetical protein
MHVHESLGESGTKNSNNVYVFLSSYAVQFQKKNDLELKAPWINTVRSVRVDRWLIALSDRVLIPAV